MRPQLRPETRGSARGDTAGRPTSSRGHPDLGSTAPQHLAPPEPDASEPTQGHQTCAPVSLSLQAPRRAFQPDPYRVSPGNPWVQRVRDSGQNKARSPGAQAPGGGGSHTLRGRLRLGARMGALLGLPTPDSHLPAVASRGRGRGSPSPPSTAAAPSPRAAPS